MEQFKKIGTAILRGVHRVLTHRAFAALVMGCAAVALAAGISTNSHVITVNDGEDSRVVVTVHEDPYQVLNSAGVELEEHDAISVNTQESTIDVDRAMTIEVQADGLSTLVHMTEGTVNEAIKKAGITVGKSDDINKKLTASVEDGMLITIDRVAYDEYSITQSIDYEVVYKYTGVLRPGQTKVRTYGEEGVRTITYRKTIVNGKVTDTQQISDEVTKEPVNKVILKGTNLGTPMSKAPFHVELDEGGQPVNYKKVLSGTCTAYTSDAGDSGAYTATGRRAAVGLVAVNPNVIPYGTKLWITSEDGSIVYGYAIAADTGGALMSGHALADLYMDTLVECNAFGRRNMKVYILD